MPNKKVSALSALAAAPATNDFLPIVDLSDTTDSANGTTKKITVANFFTTPTIGSFTNATHNHTNAAGGAQLTDAALSAAVSIAKGGTGQTTQTAAFDALAPTTTQGDIIYHNGSDNIRLAKGTAGQSLVMNSGATAPEWGGAGTQQIIGALDNSVVKTYFNVQLLFILWTGSTNDNLVTDVDNWSTGDITKFLPTKGGAMADAISTGAAHLFLETPFLVSGSTYLLYNKTNIIIMDWWAKLPSSSTGDINMGFGSELVSFQGVWNDTTGNGAAVKFAQKSTGELMAVIAEEGVGVSSSDISSGLTLTNWNNYRIELDLGNEAKFYVNGTLKATLSGANLETDALNVCIGFGRSDTALFQVTAPTISLQMNP